MTRKHDLGRALIAERPARYCWGYDERRPELLEDCFTEDAVWEGDVGAAQAVGPIQGRQAIVDWLTSFWPHQSDQRRHILLNTLIERQAAAEATTLSYLLLLSAKGDRVSLETTGFYRLELVGSEGGWRIRHLFAGFDAPFWPGRIEDLSERARRRHGLLDLAVGESGCR